MKIYILTDLEGVGGVISRDQTSPGGYGYEKARDWLTAEVNANYENLMEGEFMLNEFIDRYGPRMAHLNGLLQVLSQLGATPSPTVAPNP